MMTLAVWWFGGDTLPNGDGRAVVAGESLTVDPPLELCRRGLHGSERIIDALTYADTERVWRCELRGEILRGDDKACATERYHEWSVDATDILRAFARSCALDVVHLWEAPEIVARYLRTGDESIRDASREAAEYSSANASEDASWAASMAAGRAASRDAAAAAAGDAAREAAEYASWYAYAAAGDAAAAAVEEAARDAQNERLTEMITTAWRATIAANVDALGGQ